MAKQRRISIPKLLSLLILFCALFTVSYTLNPVPCPLAYAAIPHLINYQGRLTDKDSKPLEGSHELTFRIYDAETGPGTMTPWEETQTVTIQKGIFSVLLGGVTNLNLPFDKPYFLEIVVGGEKMNPRQRITSAGYAIKAEEAEKLGGKQPSDYALAADITPSPTANKAVKLDANAKLPVGALKVYDSGWFAVSIANFYTKTHNLGTTKVILTVYYSDTSDGSGDVVPIATGWVADGATNGAMQLSIVDLDTTTLTIGGHAARVISYYDKNGVAQNKTSGYARIIMIAVE